MANTVNNSSDKQPVNAETVRRIAQRERMLRFFNPQRQCVGKKYSKYAIASLLFPTIVGA